ncbi:hypothetical protein DFH28DRAFT_892709 [Melampsora americana]|nr:hypothetical protein DFH28DRAFT_892709 [Melampsora americana]
MPNTRSQKFQPSQRSPTRVTLSSTSASRSGRVRKTVTPAPQTKKRPPRSQAATTTTITTTTSTTEPERRFNDNLSDQFNPNNELSDSEEEELGNLAVSQAPATKRPRTRLADFSAHTTTNTTTQKSVNNSLNDDSTLPTVSNYQTLAKEWSTSRISEARRQAVPPSGQPASLAERNRIIGNKWTTLSDMEHMVYDPAIFYTLSGLPSPKKLQPVDLSPADRNELQNIYDESVSIRKISKVYASVAEGHPGVEVIGDCPKRGFPRKPDPAQYLRDKGFPVEVVQLPGSTLRHEDLLLGFDKMNSKRTHWLNDLKAGYFKFKQISDVPNQVNNSSGPNNSRVSNSAEEDNLADTQGEDDEWGGISNNMLEDIDPDLNLDNDDLPYEDNF